MFGPSRRTDPSDRRRRRWYDGYALRLGFSAAAFFIIGAFVVFGANVRTTQELSQDNEAQVAQLEKIVKRQHRALASIQRERANRISAQDAINAYVCRTNDDQDQLLAGLIAASLIGVDEKALTTEQLEGKRIFEAALNQLQDKKKCAAVVEGQTHPKMRKRQSNG